jgi:hypothetical protein
MDLLDSQSRSEHTNAERQQVRWTLLAIVKKRRGNDEEILGGMASLL